MDRPWARVPDWVGPALRPELLGATEEIIAAVRAGVPEYARPLEGRFGRRITEGVSVALTQFVDLLGVDSSPGDLRVYRGLGQLEHREGRTLAALQSAYQVGTRTAWRRIAGSSAARQLPADVIFALAEALFSYVEQLGAASVTGWAYEDARNAGSVQTRRHALVELLARQPPASVAEVERVAAAAAWRLPERLAALVVEDAVAVAARLPGAVGANLDPVGVALVPVPERPVPGRTAWCDRVRIAVRDRPAVLGPVVAAGPGGPFRRPGAGRRGRCTSPGSSAPQPTGLVRADDHLLALLLAAEPELAADLCEHALAPLRELPPGAGGAGRADAARVARRARRRLRGGRDPARAPADGALPAGGPARGVRRRAGRPGGAPGAGDRAADEPTPRRPTLPTPPRPETRSSGTSVGTVPTHALVRASSRNRAGPRSAGEAHRLPDGVPRGAPAGPRARRPCAPRPRRAPHGAAVRNG